MNEKLEAAARAEAERRVGEPADNSTEAMFDVDAHVERFVEGANWALERAHTPTDDERDIEYRDSAESDEWKLAIAGASQRDIDAAKRENELQGWEKYRITGTESESLDESVPCPECGEPRPFGLDFMCLDCNGVRYVSENDWYAHHGCGFEEEWKYQREAREAITEHLASCDWSEPSAEAQALVDAVQEAMDRYSETANLDGGDSPISWVPVIRIEEAIDSVPLPFVSEPQGEPSDAQALENFLGKLAGDGAYALDFSSAESLHGHIVSLLKRDIAALRAAGGVR